MTFGGGDREGFAALIPYSVDSASRTRTPPLVRGLGLVLYPGAAHVAPRFTEKPSSRDLPPARRHRLDLARTRQLVG